MASHKQIVDQLFQLNKLARTRAEAEVYWRISKYHYSTNREADKHNGGELFDHLLNAGDMCARFTYIEQWLDQLDVLYARVHNLHYANAYLEMADRCSNQLQQMRYGVDDSWRYERYAERLDEHCIQADELCLHFWNVSRPGVYMNEYTMEQMAMIAKKKAVIAKFR
jgi:hypothetical protein